MKAWQSLQGKSLSVKGETQKGNPFSSQSLLTMDKRVDEEITKLFKKLPYDPKDFPVGNITSLATLISEIEDIRRFPSSKQFLSHFGRCPQSFHTGSYKREHPRMSHARAISM